MVSLQGLISYNKIKEHCRGLLLICSPKHYHVTFVFIVLQPKNTVLHKP